MIVKVPTALLAGVLLIVLQAISGLSEDSWTRGPEMESVVIENPNLSRGLTPVSLKQIPDRPSLIIAREGKTLLPLVIPNSSGKYYREVASFLKQYLDEACGADFQIVTTETKPEAGIFIGPCEQAIPNELIDRAGKLPPEHFVIARVENGIALLGRDISREKNGKDVPLGIHHRDQSRGTYFAASEFLERFVGVRFYMPGKLGTHVPYLNSRSLEFPSIELTDGPRFQMRLSSYGNYLTKDHELLNYTPVEGSRWMSALRTSDYYGLKSSHTDGLWADVYAGQHPDWFALRLDGSRMVGDQGPLSAHRCYSNDAAFNEHIAAIARYYDTGEGTDRFYRNPPNEKYIYWWPNDGFRGCQCGPCLAKTDAEGPREAMYSRLIWGYTDRLAREIKKRWPDKILVASFYSRWSDGPGDIKLPDNVTWMIVETREAYMKEPVYWDRVTADLTEKMNLSGSPVALWSHYPHRPRIHNRLDAPYLVPYSLQRYVRFLDGKSSGVYLNGHNTASFALDGFAIYLYKKLLWNPDLDVDAMLEEYCHLMFGPAAQEVLEYYKTVITRWEDHPWENLSEAELDDPHRNIKWTRYYQDAYPPEVRQRLQKLLTQAKSRTDPDTVFHARTHYLTEALKPFFRQGEQFDSGASGASRFSGKTIWKSDFNPFDENWKISLARDDIQVSHSIEDGRLVLQVKSGKMDARENLGKSEEVTVSFLPKKRPFVSALKNPTALEWRYRFSGPGVLRIRAHAGSTQKQRLSANEFQPAKLEGTGWILGSTGQPDEPQEGALEDLSYCFFAIKVLPDSDFTFEIDRLEVTEYVGSEE